MRIGTCSAASPAAAADLCAFSKCFGGDAETFRHRDRRHRDRQPQHHQPEEQHLVSTSLVMNTADKFRTEQPSTYLEEMNTKIMQGRFQKTTACCSTSWPRYGHKTYPVSAARKYNLLKSCADIKRERAVVTSKEMPDDVMGALDRLSKTIDEQIVDHKSDRHVTLIKVRQADEEIHGRLEYAKDLMSTDEVSEESLKADEEVRSYMAADFTNEDDDDDDDNRTECENLKKLISTVKNNVKQSYCSPGISVLLYTLSPNYVGEMV